MGALHEGHLDLIRRALAGYDRVICSIFVNPLQFNNQEDYERYPDRSEEDRQLLEAMGCQALFYPRKENLLKDFTASLYDLGGLDAHWEGPSRPGHFQGVVNIVERLFAFVRPDAALFGEKDRQQLAIIQHVAARLNWPEKIIACPTVRATDGVALSSRNLRLSPEERNLATALYKSLMVARETAFNEPLDKVVVAGRSLLEKELRGGVDYFGIAHPETLVPLLDWGQLDTAVALVAAQVGPVRLIDNITLHRA